MNTATNVSDTQAVSGANNHGNQASECLVEAGRRPDSSAEGLVVVEPPKPGNPVEARSDETHLRVSKSLLEGIMQAMDSAESLAEHMTRTSSGHLRAAAKQEWERISYYRNCLSELLNNQGATMQQLQIPPLTEGEIYIGAIGDAAGNLHHVILLPGDNDDATHEAQLEWAKSIGGDLPTRIEQAMLWANHRDQFQKDAYWSNEIHHAESGWAWFQYFDYGGQSILSRDYELRARAVRRLPI